MQKVVHKVLQRNGYFAHPEAILLSMLADENADLRALAVNQILMIHMKAQEQSQASNQQEDDGRRVDDLDDDNELAEENDDGLQMDPSEKAVISNSKIRQYIILNINFAASTYSELIDWEISKLSEPPLILSLTNSDLMAIKEFPFSVPDYPCYTQAVERAVCLVSEASSSLIGQEARDGLIRQRIQASKELKSHASRRDYYPQREAPHNL